MEKNKKRKSEQGVVSIRLVVLLFWAVLSLLNLREIFMCLRPEYHPSGITLAVMPLFLLYLANESLPYEARFGYGNPVVRYFGMACVIAVLAYISALGFGWIEPISLSTIF